MAKKQEKHTTRFPPFYITKREKYIRSALIAREDLCALPAGQRRSQSAARGRRVPYKEKKNSFVNII